MNKIRQKHFITSLHNSTKRNYLERMINNKVFCINVASKYDKDYWDGDRKFGYGGYQYIPGRWKNLAKELINTYSLNNKSNVLDIGCGKGYLLQELKLLIPDLKVTGIDISNYSILNAHPNIKKFLSIHDARKKLPFEENQFDLVFSLGAFHNFILPDLVNSLTEMERVGRQKYLMVESYRDSQELFNLQCWALTAQTFFNQKEWIWFLDKFYYSGDYEFIFFE